MGSTRAATRSIAEVLAENRARLFVGRDAELAAFARLLDPQDPCRVLFVHGPGGIGKTSLLNAAIARARSEGWAVARCDARSAPAEPDAVRLALGAALAGAAPGADQPQLLVIDTFEEWAAVEGWLRDDLLPSFLDSTHVLIAGRRPPGVRWRSDAGWHRLFEHLALPPLSPEESRDYLVRRGIESDLQDRTTDVAHGHPLLLALLADALGSSALSEVSDELLDRTTDDLLIELVDHLVPASTKPEERRALYASALLRHTTEHLLKEMLGVDEVRTATLWRWLQQLSFVDASPIGLFPHDVMRDALRTALERRDPELRVQLLDAAVHDYLERIRSSGDPVLMSEHLYLYTNFMPSIFPEFMAESEPAYAERARPQDVPHMRAMVERHEGASRARLFDFWWQRQPGAFRVVRGSEGAVIGFFVLLEIADLPDEWLEGDDLLARFWAERSALDRPMQPGECAVLLRMWMHESRHMQPSAVGPLWSVELARALLMNPAVAMGAALHPDNEEWVSNSLLYGHRLLPGSRGRSGEESTVVYLHDFSQESALEWLESTYRRYRETTPSPPTSAVSDSIEPGVVRSALRQLHRPDRLVSHPLLERVRGDDRVASLRSHLEAECAQLRGNPKTEVLHRVLDRTYLRPASDQRAAAEACSLSWDQYRRRLTEAIKLLAARLERSLR